MRSLMQNNCAVSIKNHQFSKGVSIFFYFYWLSFYRSVKFHYRIRKIRLKCCFRGHHEKSIQNESIRRFPFVPYLSVTVLAKFHGKPSFFSTYPINSFKEEGFPRKTSASFRLLKINISRLFRGIGQLKKPPAN